MIERAKPDARYVRPGEMLAMSPSALHTGPRGMFWLFGGGAVASEQRGDVSIVHVREALEHHAAGAWGADSYEGVIARLTEEMTGAGAVARHRQAQRAHRYEHGYEDGYEPIADIEQTPPRAVILCIDSPGGAVSGLFEACASIEKMRAASPVRVVAYVNDLAASAAYALACACEEIHCPASAIVGSIGVISTMISQAEKNAKDGIDVRLLTSGARKADGHPHAPITDAAEDAEGARVDQLAATFFDLVGKSRAISTEKVQGFQAGIYLGSDAEARGLVDEIMSLDDLVLALSAESPLDKDDRYGSSTSNRETISPGAKTMLKLTAERKKLEAAIVAEKDPKKLVALAATLDAYKKVEKHVEHTKSEEDDDPEDEEKDEKEDDEEKPDASKAKADEDAASAKAEEDAEDEAEEKQASAALRLVEAATGRKGSAAIGAATALLAEVRSTRADVAKLTAAAKATERAALVKRAEKYVPARLVATMTSMASLRALVEEAEKGAPMVVTDEGELLRPKAAQPGTESSLPKETVSMIDQAVSACPQGMDRTKFRATLVDAHLKAHNERMTSALNGAGRI